MIITAYTDGSCNTQTSYGAWAAIVLVNDKKNALSGKEYNTTNNRMEITAVIKALAYIEKHFSNKFPVTIVTDSQYVEGLPARKQKLLASHFKTNKGNDITNADLVKELFTACEKLPVQFVKIRAHQKKSVEENLNIEVDKLCRKLVREASI